MIEFHLEARSGVPTYRQLVQQVRQAIRLGVLRPGDQLPTVKEVVRSLTINPNTVLRAYRELELEGLTEGRRGVGTFVADAAAPLPPDEIKALRAGAGEVGRGGSRRRVGRREHARPVCRRGAAAESLEGRMSALETEGLGKRYGSKWALRDCTLEVSEGTVTALVGPNGAGKTTLLQLAVGLLTAERRQRARARALAAGRGRRAAPAYRFRRAGAPAAQAASRSARRSGSGAS